MTDVWDEFGEEAADETVYAQGRLDSRTYASRGFTLARPASADDGEPARFLYKVFDPASESFLERDGEEWVLRETPAGRYQVKVLVAREAGNVKDLWIQRVPTAGAGQVQNMLSLRGPEIAKLLNFLRLLDSFPVAGETTVRLDDEVLHDLLNDPESMVRLYQEDPERLRHLIESDVAAADVLALERRRQAVERFRRLLRDEDFFDAAVEDTPGQRAESVWQALFEEHPWMLGVSLSGQFLTSWSEAALEQVVSGRSIAGIGKRTDALLQTSGRIRSMVLAEIKTHRTKLLGSSEYRAGCWPMSSEVIGAVSQIHGTVHRAVTQIGERLANVGSDGADLPGEYTYLLKPRTFVVVGNLEELTTNGGDHQDKIRSFELFRRQLQDPEILTFDEVLARAEWALHLAEDTID